MKKNLSKIIMILICAVLLEVIVFNITSYRTLWGDYKEKTFSIEELKEGIYPTDSDDFIYVDVNNINQKVATIKIDFSEFEDINEYTVYVDDESTTLLSEVASKTYKKEIEKSKYVPVYLSGNVEKFSVKMHKGYKDELAAQSITINEPIPFKFEFGRFMVVFIILFAGYAFFKSKIFDENYDEKNVKQELILLAVTLGFMFLLIGLNGAEDKSAYNDEYVKALAKGQTYLDYECTEGFENLEDPYDPQLRDVKGFERDKDYLWDTAYYKGRTYIYFGILPVVILFMPYYLLFNEILSFSSASLAVALLVTVLLKSILLRLVNRYFKDIPFRVVILSYIILLAGSLVLFLSSVARVYEITILFGLFFSLLGIYLMLKSTDGEKNKYLIIFTGAACLAFAVACRPNDLLITFLVVPYLLKLLIENIKNFKNNKKNLFKLIAAVAIPYILVASFLMWFNYIRFENPFEFGSNYQLTITNVRKLESRLWTIPQGMIAALFNIPTVLGKFPFIISNENMIPFNGIFYIEALAGGVFIMSPICFAIFGIFKANKVEKNKELKCLINVATVIAIIMTILTVMMAGLVPRYLADFSWIYVLTSLIITLIFYSNLKTEEAKKIYIKILTVIAIYSIIYAIFAAINGEAGFMKNKNYNTFLTLRNLICFWE